MGKKKSLQIDPNEGFPHLAAAPIAEAVIHWLARAGRALPTTELREELKRRLPDYPDCHAQHRLELQAEFTPDGSAAQMHRDTVHGFRLTSAEKLHIVQFNRDGIVFSRLTPYDDWNAFVARAEAVWNVFVDLAQPPEVQRLGVRFINRISIKKQSEMRQLLAKAPRGLENLGLPLKQFLYQSQHEVPGQPLQVQVVQTVQSANSPENGGLGLILDIDVGTTHALPCDNVILHDFLAKMHWLKNKVFFNLVSKKAIARFEKGD